MFCVIPVLGFSVSAMLALQNKHRNVHFCFLGEDVWDWYYCLCKYLTVFANETSESRILFFEKVLTMV